MFYTNVYTHGNNVLFRGIDNGKRVKHKIPFEPSLYVRSGKESIHKSLWGQNLERIKFPSINEAKDFVKKYKDVSNFPIFGNTNYTYQFISKMFPAVIKFDITQMKIVTIDIETSTEYGFPDVRNAQEEVLLITMQDYNTKEITSFGCKPYLSKKANAIYKQCKDEFDLLRQFINFL
jgi:hypothetical protein